MNIFILDEDPEKAAEYHCDKHVCKMILEAGQMLCTAHWMSWLWFLGKDRSDFRLMRDVKSYLKENVLKEKQPPWSITHVNHPCSVWTRETLENYQWHHKLMGCLLDEYTKRYKRQHKSEEVWCWLKFNQPLSFPNQGLSPFPICMKEEYKISSDPVDCYREYYIKDKVRFAKWKTQPPPWWHISCNTQQVVV